MGERKSARWLVRAGLGCAVFGGLMVAAVAVSAQDEGALPDVAAPDFADAGAVIDSMEAMMESVEAVQEAEGWRALRTLDQCETAIDILEDKVTAAAYDAAAGESNWRTCHHRYEVLKLH